MRQKIYNHYQLLAALITAAILITLSCNKQDSFLNAKRANSDVTPTTLADFQAVLDANSYMNVGYPALPLLGTDNVYLPSATVGAATVSERNSYIWASDIYQGSVPADWRNAYTIVEYANIVLDGL